MTSTAERKNALVMAESFMKILFESVFNLANGVCSIGYGQAMNLILIKIISTEYSNCLCKSYEEMVIERESSHCNALL